MKPKTFSAAIALVSLLALPAIADEARVASYTAKLRSVRVTEIAREAATLVVAETSDARVNAAADAVSAAVTLNGPSAPLVVGAVAKAAPETAPTAAATAVKIQPKLAGPIAKAAVSAAPSAMEAIVVAMCQAQPKSFYVIGVSAAQAAPKSADKVLPASTTALPGLKPLVAKSQADFAAAKRTTSLALVLKHTENILAVLSRETGEASEALLAQNEAAVGPKLSAITKAIPPPPVQLPPFVPGGGTPGEIGAAGTQETPPSGRVYSTP
jgi:hypothetical protein